LILLRDSGYSFIGPHRPVSVLNCANLMGYGWRVKDGEKILTTLNLISLTELMLIDIIL
jgi:hypothetical protein